MMTVPLTYDPVSEMPSTEPPPNTDDRVPFPVLQLIQLIVGVVGIFGNLLVCFVFIHRRILRNQTNLLITNQAFVDLVSSILMVLHVITNLSDTVADLLKGVPFFWCYFWRSQLLLFGSFAISTFNLALISLERFTAVIYPVYYARVFKRRGVSYMIVSVWVIAPALQYILAWHSFDIVDGVCFAMESPLSVGILLFFWEYFIPVCVMTLSFVTVLKKFRYLHQATHPLLTLQPVHQRSNGDRTSTSAITISGQPPPDQPNYAVSQLTAADRSNNAPSSNRSGNVRRRNLTKALVIVYVMYIVCWSPNQWAFFQQNLGGYLDFSGYFFQFSYILAICNSCVNPFIYALRHKAYREYVTELIGGVSRNIFNINRGRV